MRIPHPLISSLVFFSLFVASSLGHEWVAGHLHAARDRLLLAACLIAAALFLLWARYDWKAHRFGHMREHTEIASLFWIMLGFSFVFGHFLGVEVLALIRSRNVAPVALLVGLSYVPAILYTARIAKRIPPVAQLREASGIKEGKVPERRCLIVFLSYVTPRDGHDSVGLPNGFPRSGTIAELLQQLATKPGPPWNGEMIMRGIDAHSDVLETVFLIPSERPAKPGTYSGSIDSIPAYAELLNGIKDLARVERVEDKRFPPVQLFAWVSKSVEDGKKEYHAIPCSTTVGLKPVSERLMGYDGVDFEDYEELYDCLMAAVKRLQTSFHAKEEDITVDVTGGQKPTSIVAATVTYGRDLTTQYVQTNLKGVKSFDVTYTERPALH